MEWDALGAIAEMIGAVGVVASLVYLSIQIRHNSDNVKQNTDSQRLASYDAHIRAAHDMRASQIANKDVAELMVKGIRGDRDFDEADLWRFNVAMFDVTSAWEATFYQMSNSGLDPVHWESLKKTIKRIMSGAGARKWWRNNRDIGGFHPEFVVEMNRLVFPDEKL